MTASHPVFKPVTLPDFQNGNDTPRRNWFLRIHEAFNRGFEKLRNIYAARLDWALNHARLVIGVMVTVVMLSLVLVTQFLGEDPRQDDSGPALPSAAARIALD